MTRSTEFTGPTPRDPVQERCRNADRWFWRRAPRIRLSRGVVMSINMRRNRLPPTGSIGTVHPEPPDPEVSPDGGSCQAAARAGREVRAPEITAR